VTRPRDDRPSGRWAVRHRGTPYSLPSGTNMTASAPGHRHGATPTGGRPGVGQGVLSTHLAGHVEVDGKEVQFPHVLAT